jgi:hypothetical protein
MLKHSLIILLVLASGVAGAATAPSRDQEKPPIPPDLYFEFKAVAPEDNAIINWRKAAGLRVPLDEPLSTTIQHCWTPGARRPSDAELDALQSWYRRNKEALDEFNASIAKPKAQWPEQDPENPQPEMTALLHFTKARLFEADALASEKKFTNAVDSLEASLKLAQRGIEADGAFIHYLVSVRARTLVQSAIVRMASHRDVPLPLMERLLKDLTSLNSETNAYAQVLSAEFTRYAYHTTDVKRLAETWAKFSVTDSMFTAFYPNELRRPFKVLLDPSLVAVHPKPLDENAELNRDIRRYRIFRTNSVGAWTNRDDSFLTEDDQIIEKLTEDIKPLMELVKDEPLPLSRQAAERARKAYLELENPVGRIFAGSLSTFVASDRNVFLSRTEREAMRATIGLLIFERRKGVLPDKLSDLVNEKILNVVPFDFLANAPMSYSRERRIVWSVGEDGENNDGESDGKFHWYKGDAVWKIPELN